MLFEGGLTVLAIAAELFQGKSDVNTTILCIYWFRPRIHHLPDHIMNGNLVTSRGTEHVINTSTHP